MSEKEKQNTDNQKTEEFVNSDAANVEEQEQIHTEAYNELEEDNDEVATPKDAQQEVDDANAADGEDDIARRKYEIEMKNYHSLTMNELIKELSDLLKNEKIQTIQDHVREIKAAFDAKFEEEMEQKKEDFLEEGGNIIDFYYSSPIQKKFHNLYFEYRERRNEYYTNLKKNLNENLKVRLTIIEELKGMIGFGDDMNANFNKFKELQERWKKAGPVPRDQYNNIWNTYHHHVEHFYDYLHLDKEFRDMDFKHNLEQKLKIIARAEELTEEKDPNRAFRELQMLHKIWKEDLGPVEKQYRDDIWDKFSNATKKIHDNRQAHFMELDKIKEKNLVEKNTIIDQILSLSTTKITSYKQAQQLIDNIEKLREDFFNIGKVPQKEVKNLWDKFKNAVRAFNKNKNTFYKNIKKEHFSNLEKKQELIAIAEKHKDSEDYETATPIMKKIQSEWKKIGHVPRKNSNDIWKQFSDACNHYFNRLHEQRNEQNQEENRAFEEKKELLEKVKKINLTGEREKDLETIKAQIEAWKKIGRVSYNKRYIEGKFNKALDNLFEKIDIERKQAEMMKYENRIQALDEANDNEKIEQEELFLRKKIEETKATILQFENNLQFFSNTNPSNPIIKDVLKNIKRHKDQLDTWKAKLRKVKEL